jgi:hypothetical protein
VPRLLLTFLALLSAALFAESAPAPASPLAYSTDEADYPHVIHVRFWPSKEGFRPGDKVTITSVRGTLPRLQPGGVYLVQGTYTLASEIEGMLGLSRTSNHLDTSRRWPAATQSYQIEKGSGTFRLAARMIADGQYHVSLYFPDRAAPLRKDENGAPLPPPRRFHGGIYFDNR